MRQNLPNAISQETPADALLLGRHFPAMLRRIDFAVLLMKRNMRGRHIWNEITDCF